MAWCWLQAEEGISIRGALHPESAEAPVGDAERLVSVGCAIQNILLSAHAAGFGTVTRHKPAHLRPAVSDYVSELG